MNKYPIYVPSKGRYESGLTAKMLIRDKVPFYLVIEPSEYLEYKARYESEYTKFLILPWDGNDGKRLEFSRELNIENGGLICARNWIKAHSIQGGDLRHWQLDDNIRNVYRRYKTLRLHCNSGIALRFAEIFTDRYKNISISGLEYHAFVQDKCRIPAYRVNGRIYSCSLINNAMPFKWRIAYNDDVDICLQSISSGWYTIQINAFLIKKMQTMKLRGGNTDDLYRGDGRLKMANAIARIWPNIVQVKRRFKRPQHVINWQKLRKNLEPIDGLDINQTADEAESLFALDKTGIINDKELNKIYNEYVEKYK
jgi:hypothetical protein